MDTQEKAGCFLVFLIVGAWISFWIAIIWVACHFIAKFW